MNVLFLPQSGELGPSSRYRVYQLLPRLEQHGIHGTVSPGIGEELYRRIYLETPPPDARRRAFQAIWQQRKRDLMTVENFDAVFIQKNFFPGLYAGWEKKIAARRPMFVDVDDAIWLPRQGGHPLLRLLHRESRVQSVFARATTVFAGNEFLAAYARRFNRSVIVVPSSIDTTRYPSTGGGTVVGWIGSRTTLPYMQPLAEVFRQLKIIPRVIAAGDPSVLGFPVDFRLWQLSTELNELSQIGIGIAPLPDTPWENGKCGVKLLQYMACGMPVIASPVGVHRDIIEHGVNGFLATTPAEWRSCLEQLLGDESLRQRLGAAGRATVQKNYDVGTAAGRLAKALLASTQM